MATFIIIFTHIFLLLSLMQHINRVELSNN